jgi:NAD+ synthase
LNSEKIKNHIVNWLTTYCGHANLNGFIVGISGGIDSALTSTLCALTGKKVLILTMPIHQTSAEYNRAIEHIEDLKSKFPQVEGLEIDLTPTFDLFTKSLPLKTQENHLAMANSRARIRMTTLYALGQEQGLLVAGTGNKIEDFGVGFYTKYGDGGVDLSPIADLTKTQVFTLSKHLGIIPTIQNAKPTDGLWEDGRSDEDQIGASYPELEWAMDFKGNSKNLEGRQKEVFEIYSRLNRINKHKMEPIPVCEIPNELF